MAVIARIVLAEQPVDAAFWPRVAREAGGWAQSCRVSLRDAVVLVPYAQLLGPARRAFAACGGWQPRIETTQTLRASLGPAPLPQPGHLRLDIASDRLAAAALLRRHGWPSHDRPAFEHAVAAVVETAHALARAGAALPRDERGRYWAAARDAMSPLDRPGLHEALLARVALEWAALSDDGANDALFECRPAAWIVVRAVGADALTDRLVEGSDAPALLIDTDPPTAAPFDAVARLVPPRVVRCDGLEQEARATALAVIDAVRRGATQVALVSHDRVVVRRVRALLERAGVALHDETGWKLSTTRAAARVMALLRAADTQARADARIDWLKSDSLGENEPSALASLERCWRRGAAPDGAALALWQRASARLAVLGGAAAQPLAAWLHALHGTLGETIGRLDADPAGRQVLAALHLDGAPDAAWRAVAEDGDQLDFAAFTAWIDTALEHGTFVAAPAGDAPVVVTPLARTALRPFGAVVFPGADERRLGVLPPPDGLLDAALARRLGVPDRDSRRERETLAFAQLFRAPALTLVYRSSEAGEPLGPSALIERAELARARAGLAVPPTETAALPLRRVEPRPIDRPAPAARHALPAALSASAIEALRDCPYRFFARVVLGLAETPELDAAVEKRDYGSWLHAVLHRFHRQRVPAAAADETTSLLAIADALRDEAGLDEAQLLPYRASLEQLAPLYVAWLHERDAAGWNWVDGEVAREIAPPLLEGVALRGRIDRIDRRGATLQLIDYKTGSATDLAKKVRQPLEDTQLAVYAALMDSASDDLQAIYLALDESKAPQEIAHPDVARTARELLDGLAGDLRRIRAGHGLAALGEGRLCELCEARGLCRRDHWSTR